MAITDPIADALTIIRNATKANKKRVDLKASTLLSEVLKALKREKFIYDFRLIEDKKQGILRTYLKKEEHPTRKITKIMKISKPSLRIYKRKDEIPAVLNGLGICVISTSQGILTGDEARQKGVGGEILLKIW